uniref:E3 ubiquitin-protein ligase Topors n=1 Tax=Buteo japonicus TaxID=224669 RepID=A0A8C0ASA5_9AVES
MATELENRCPICLDSWEEASYVMPCLHPFCYPCILRWAESKPECPLCKRKVTSILHSVQADDNFKEHVLTPSLNVLLILEFLCSLSPASSLKWLGTASVKTEMKAALSTSALPAFALAVSLNLPGKQARTFLA